MSVGQLKTASEILGNLSVAWFSAGIISPFFIQPKSGSELMMFLVIGSSMSALFAILALTLVKEVKQ